MTALLRRRSQRARGCDTIASQGTTNEFASTLPARISRQRRLVSAFLAAYQKLAAAEKSRLKIRDIKTMTMQGPFSHLPFGEGGF